ncbi:MAG: HIT family protein [Candidatus Cloacimonetes bacterium]|jgi:diadenosine tetraphosphate (Ap4A) HIT family hydrolase|nr:HIT family protein [Candidatus Cloacimonadota bacterium]
MCVFCDVPDDKKVQENELFFAIYDSRPVSRGHILIISKRHVESFFDLTGEEVMSLLEMSNTCHSMLEDKFGPTGYNIAINYGRSAGQTIFHFHLHIIPRYG